MDGKSSYSGSDQPNNNSSAIHNNNNDDDEETATTFAYDTAASGTTVATIALTTSCTGSLVPPQPHRSDENLMIKPSQAEDASSKEEAGLAIESRSGSSPQRLGGGKTTRLRRLGKNNNKPNNGTGSLSTGEDDMIQQLPLPRNRGLGKNSRPAPITPSSFVAVASMAASTADNFNNSNANGLHYDPLAEIEPLPDHQPTPQQQLEQRGPGAHHIAGEGGGGAAAAVRPSEAPSEAQERGARGAGGVQQHITPVRDLDLEALNTIPNNSNSNSNNNSSNSLVEALPISAAAFQSSFQSVFSAQPVYDDDPKKFTLEDHHRKAAKNKRILIGCCCMTGIAILIILLLSLVFGLDKKEDQNTNDTTNQNTNAANDPPTSTNPILLLPPPMDNLELLYQELPLKTRDSLRNNHSIQYKAWEWLHNHPNITAYPEWRKQQIYAMSTFFLAMQGPNWPQGTPGSTRWMNYDITNECDWVMTDLETKFFSKEALKVFGPGSYELHDFHPCNQRGELQTINLHRLYLSSSSSSSANNTKPYIPPEIELLTSLRLLGIVFSEIPSKLSDLLVPELIQLPTIEGINFQGSGVGGTIPPDVFALLNPNLRHLPIGANRLTGTLPTQIALLTKLEFLSVSQSEGLTGNLPSQLGRLTSLTALFTYGSYLTGPLPTELGRLTNMVQLELWNNAFTGPIPPELGAMTNIVDFKIGNDLGMVQGFYNDFSGVLPNEVWHEFSNLQTLFLSNLPNLKSRIPSNNNNTMMPNLTSFRLDGSSQFSGTIPDQICSSIPQMKIDCTDLLCGCYCPCRNHNNSSNNIHNLTNP